MKQFRKIDAYLKIEKNFANMHYQKIMKIKLKESAKDCESRQNFIHILNVNLFQKMILKKT